MVLICHWRPFCLERLLFVVVLFLLIHHTRETDETDAAHPADSANDSRTSREILEKCNSSIKQAINRLKKRVL
ncbi:MAG TPA: hypothetical protein VFN35_15650, partial [Ktedonobacteraceae bacterium]|nr:hypothetical protein [Ktedonobacteraceae bacterium]